MDNNQDLNFLNQNNNQDLFKQIDQELKEKQQGIKNSRIDDLRNEVDTSGMETTGMESSVGLESAPASESGIITEDNTVEMSDITEFSEGLMGDNATAPEVVTENNIETSTEMTFDSNDTDAAIAAQMASEEAAAQKQKTSDTGVEITTDTPVSTSTAQTASITSTDFKTSDGVMVESNGNANVVTVGNDAIMDSIRTE